MLPILLGVLGAIGALAFWILRARDVAHASRDLADVAGDFRLAARRLGLSGRHEENPIEAVTDPRLAAAGVMASMALLDGPLSEAELGEIVLQCRKVFEVDDRDARDISVYGQWLAGQRREPSDALMHLTKRFTALASDDAPRRDVMAMVSAVAAVGDGPSEQQKLAIGQTQRRLGLV